jgi:hypothetical protein
VSFQLDEDKTLDAMAHASTVDLMAGQVTLYAVVCCGSGEAPHYSHGGQLTLNAHEAIEVAKSENVDAEAEGIDCHYLAAAVGIDPAAIAHIYHNIGRGPQEEM